MLDIIVAYVGKNKEEYFRRAGEEYVKRLGPYAKIFLHEIKSEPFYDGTDKERAKDAEAERILKFLENFSDDEIILLEEEGKEMDSVEFADFIKDNQAKKIVFVIAGALGFGKEVKEKNFKRISLSKMTFPHELARVVLLEQIYRAVAIMKNKKYHY